MPYHANGGSYCKAIVSKLGASLGESASCQAEADPCTPSVACCSGLTCEKTPGGGWDMQCRAPPCVKAGDVIQDGQTCCDGAMPYHANGGSYCKAIVSKLGASLGESASCQAEADPCTPSVACCSGLTCDKTPGGGWDMQCTAPPCVKAGDVIQDGQTCCDGTMPYHANGGSYCKAI